jgi:hypothetical protein
MSTIPQSQGADNGQDESKESREANEKTRGSGVQERLRRAQGTSSPAYGFRLVRYAVGAVTVIFISVLVYALIDNTLFDSATQLIAAMSAAFTIIGSVVAAYFGIKAGLDGQDKVNDARDRERQQARMDRQAEQRSDGQNSQGGQGDQPDRGDQGKNR